MKNKLLLALMLVFASATFAQNVQLHYDLGEGRKFFTSTVEMFKPDKYGSTFFFVDMDYSSDARNVSNGVSLAYWEIARAFKWKENQMIMPRVEYNGGTMSVGGSTFIPIENCWLAGIEHTWASADFSKIFTLQGNYKYIQDKENASFQITGVWVIQLLKGKLTFTGFADFWKEGMDWTGDGNTDTKFRFLTEPQIWYNINSNLAVGGEVEISSNFVGDKFFVSPTVACKWTF